MFMQKKKTVRKSVGAKGMFGKIISRFKTKPKQRVNKNITKPPVIVSKKIPTKTKLGHDRKANSKTTIDQVRKIFVIKKENPNLSQENIGSIVGMSGVLVRYYSTMGKTKALSTFKKKDLKIKTKLKKAEKRAKKNLKKTKPESVTIYEGTATIVELPEQPSLTEKQAKENLDKLYKKEAIPEEHQADPRYFAGTLPRESVATEESFSNRKRRNNINRAVVAKKIAKDNQEALENSVENKRKGRLRDKHTTTEPKIHWECCPSCNPTSNLTVDEYNKIIRQESWRRKQYGEKQRQLLEKEKRLDEQHKEPTVAERTQQGTQLCRICEKTIPYSQSTRSMSRFGEYYCGDHEPKL